MMIRHNEKKSRPRWPYNKYGGRCSILLIVAQLLIAFNAAAQTTEPKELEMSPAGDFSGRLFRFGAAAGLGFLFNNTDFDVYSSGPECGQFTGTTGTTSARLFFETDLYTPASLSLTSSLLFRDISANLLSQSFPEEGRFPNGTFDTIQKQHRFEASISGIGIGAGIVWNGVKGLRAGIYPGITFLSAGSVRQTEEIVEPLGATFSEGGDYIREVDRGEDVVFAQSVVDLTVILGSSMGLTKGISLYPEVSATVLLTSISENIPWTGTSLQFSVGVTYDYYSGKTLPPLPPPQGPERPPLLPREPEVAVKSTYPMLQVDIQAVGIDAQNREYPDPIIEIEEAPWIESIPVIPVVFFEQGQSEIPARYRGLQGDDKIDEYSVDSLVGVTPMDIHAEVLNVLGERMRGNKDAGLTITGTVSGDEGEDAVQLGLGRAQAVRDYLVAVWGIAPQRINTLYAPKPTEPSNEGTAEGRQENRRAELHFTDEHMTAPVIVERLARVASPPEIKFYPKAYADTTIVDWYVSVLQGKKELLRFDGNSDRDALNNVKNWPLGDMRVTGDITPVKYRLVVTDITGQTGSAERQFTVKERTTRKQVDSLGRHLEVHEHAIVGFSYNSAALNTAQLNQLENIVEQIPEGADIQIVGYTDKLGDPVRNKELSLQRAQAVRDALKNIQQRLKRTGATSYFVNGVGGDEPLYNNSLPEGRTLSRMVRITVRGRVASPQ